MRNGCGRCGRASWDCSRAPRDLLLVCSSGKLSAQIQLEDAQKIYQMSYVRFSNYFKVLNMEHSDPLKVLKKCSWLVVKIERCGSTSRQGNFWMQVRWRPGLAGAIWGGNIGNWFGPTTARSIKWGVGSVPCMKHNADSGADSVEWWLQSMFKIFKLA